MWQLFSQAAAACRSSVKVAHAYPSLDWFSWNFALCTELRNIWEQLIFELIDCLPLRGSTGMRVHLKRRAHVRVTELGLGHFQRRAELVQQSAMCVPKRGR
jgi:hypothetical protein